MIDVWLLHGIVMPMMVFLILVINELINSGSRGEETSKDSHGRWIEKSVTSLEQHSNKKKVGCNKTTLFIQVFRVAVPTVSVLFVLSFFAMAFSNPSLE